MVIANAIDFQVLSIQPEACLSIEMKRTKTKRRIIAIENSTTLYAKRNDKDVLLTIVPAYLPPYSPRKQQAYWG